MVVSKALKEQLDLRNLRILQMKEIGYSLQVIADAENITPQRASQIIKKIEVDEAEILKERMKEEKLGL